MLSDACSYSRRAVLSTTDLVEDTGVFLSMTDVGDNQMHHFTSVDSRRSISHDGILRATNTSSPYDALVHNKGSGANVVPKSLYFRMNSSVEHIHFPFSWYPRAAEPGSETACLSVDLDILRSDEYRMFYGSSTPTQFGQDFVIRVHSHVVFAREPEHVAYCVENFVELDKADNRIMRFSDDGSTFYLVSVRSVCAVLLVRCASAVSYIYSTALFHLYLISVSRFSGVAHAIVRNHTRHALGI